MARQFLASLAVFGLFTLSSSAEYVRWHKLDVGEHKGQNNFNTQHGSRQVTRTYEGVLFTPEKIAELQFRRSAAAHDALQLEQIQDHLASGLLEGQEADSSDPALPCGPYCTECNDATGECLVCQDTAVLVIDPPSSLTPRVHCRSLHQMNCAPGAASDVFGCSACPEGFGMSSTGPPFSCDVACPGDCMDCDNVLRSQDSDDEGMCNVCVEGYEVTGNGFCEPSAGWPLPVAALKEAMAALMFLGSGGGGSSSALPAAELPLVQIKQVSAADDLEARSGAQRLARAQQPNQALGAAARQGSSVLLTYDSTGGATMGTIMTTRTSWWAAAGGLPGLPSPQGSLLASLMSAANLVAMRSQDASEPFQAATLLEDADPPTAPDASAPLFGEPRQQHSAADAAVAAARSSPWWEGSSLGKALAERLIRLSSTAATPPEEQEQREGGTPESNLGSASEASSEGNLQEVTLQAARELAAATGLSQAAALDKAASVVLQSYGQGTIHAGALPTTVAEAVPHTDSSVAVPPQPLPDQATGGWVAPVQALLSRAVAAVLGGRSSGAPDQDMATEVPPVDGLVSVTGRPQIYGSASNPTGALFPVEPSLVSDMQPLRAAAQEGKQQAALPAAAAVTANRRNNGAAHAAGPAALLPADAPALAPAQQ